MIPDDRLRLVFTCCHPALGREAQVALTLRLVCGLSTGEIAQAFLVSEPTMAARVTRAKKKISAARIPYRVPGTADLPDRLDAVLTVVHLLFTTGHTAPTGDQLVRHDLVERAIDLARMLRLLMPDEREVRGLLALMLLTDARRATRARSPTVGCCCWRSRTAHSGTRPPSTKGGALVLEALRGGRPGRFALQAAIAALHAEAPTLGRDRLAADPRPVRRAADALGRHRWWPSTGRSPSRWSTGRAAGLAEVERLEADPRLAGYRYLPATKADLLRRLDRPTEAALAYREALALADNAAEKRFLARRLDEVTAAR